MIISLTGILFELARQCNENAHEAQKALIDKYEVSDEKQESLNEVTNRWNSCRINGTIQYPGIWFNELYNLNLKFNKIKEKYERDEYEMKAHEFDVLPEKYKPVRVSCNVNISMMAYKDLKKEIRWFCKTELGRSKKQEKQAPENKVLALNKNTPKC